MRTLPARGACTVAWRFSPNGQLLLAASGGRDAETWDRSGVPGPVLRGHSGPVTSASFAESGDLVVTTSADETAMLWRLDGSVIARLHAHSGRVTCASFGSRGREVVTGFLRSHRTSLADVSR